MTHSPDPLTFLIEEAAGMVMLADAQDPASIEAMLPVLDRLTQALGATHPSAAAACRNAGHALAKARTGNDPASSAAALKIVADLLTRIQAAVRENRDLSSSGNDAATEPHPEQTSLPSASPSPPTPVPTPAATLALPGRYLVFRLGPEEFGLEILKVQEIVSVLDITRVPHTPSFLKGVCNLRGQVIPVVDWRLKFNLEAMAATEKTCMIVVKVHHHDKPAVIATIVDEVAEVIEFTSDAIAPAPTFGASVDVRFLSGMGKQDRRLVMLLDVERVLSLEELTGRTSPA